MDLASISAVRPFYREIKQENMHFNIIGVTILTENATNANMPAHTIVARFLLLNLFDIALNYV